MQSKEEKNAEEIARWDESKKWQKKLEALKGKLADSDIEVSKLSKENKGQYQARFELPILLKKLTYPGVIMLIYMI